MLISHELANIYPYTRHHIPEVLTVIILVHEYSEGVSEDGRIRIKEQIPKSINDGCIKLLMFIGPCFSLIVE
jgi:hypothetical protein